ncbi:MAG: methyltransferase domain-containing protein [Proteobacteria bacterium]|nr:methyltransferase domain-containing protein [Pseudomonadota bacterium]
MARAAAAVASGRTLDLGCGDGYLVSLLGADAIGVDFSDGEVAAAARRGVAVVRGRAEQLPFADRSFRTVVSHLAFMLMDAAAVAREVERVLTDDGTFAAILGGGPTADGDDAFHRYVAIAPSLDVPLVDRMARSEAGWRALFPRRAVDFERVVLDLSGTFDEVWRVLGTSYEGASVEDFRDACASFGARIPLAMVVWLATARPRSAAITP